MAMLENLARIVKDTGKYVAFKYTPFGAPRYPYPNVEPIELATLINEIERLKQTAGNIVEIGVARGMTTRFLCEHLVAQRLEKTLTYFAVDTFASFINSDMKYEVEKRGKKLSELRAFWYNDFDVWKRNFTQFGFVTAVRGDCAALDYAQFAPVKIAFLDVDLYLPTKRALPKIYDAMVQGGTILVDDVRENYKYDGAYHAYMEFCMERGLQPRVIGNKCGVVCKG